MTESPDWEALIQEHLDGQTSADEVEALSNRIVDDADVRSRYLAAAQIHGALSDEVLALDLEEGLDGRPAPVEKKKILSFAWPQQIAAALVAGALVGLIGVGVVGAVHSPKSEARFLPIANGNFEDSVGPVEIGFPATFGHWSGDPAEVVEEADGNQRLRFLETANVTGKPGGGASACNVFQLVDLSALRQQWDTENPEAQFTLELSAHFHREAVSTDADLPKSRLTMGIQLYRAEPESIGKGWPHVIREAIAVGNKPLRLAPGEASTLSSSCVLDPEANLALISLNANSGSGISTPTELGGYFVDDVQLTLIKQPNLPVRFVKN